MNTLLTNEPAVERGTFILGGDLPIRRLGFGTARLTGAGAWGEPSNRRQCVSMLRRAVELGVTFIDTADVYGPEIAEQIIAEALFPYPEDLVIATKAGLRRMDPGLWIEDGRPAHLRDACDGSLRRLKLERIPLFQLHRVDPKVPLGDQIAALLDLQREGKIRHIGLSEVTVKQIMAVTSMTPVATVQNRYHVADRNSEAVLNYCAKEDIGFIPWIPLAGGALARPGGLLEEFARRLGAAPAQVALAWLLQKSPVMLPIPGASTVNQIEINMDAMQVTLHDSVLEELEQAMQPYVGTC
jgi:pyridoxine 4-dehydrogenase